MKIRFFQYLSSAIILFFLGILVFDNIILPSYVGYNNEIYLPDIRGKYLYKGKKILNDKGFKVEVVYVPYDKNGYEDVKIVGDLGIVGIKKKSDIINNEKK